MFYSLNKILLFNQAEVIYAGTKSFILAITPTKFIEHHLTLLLFYEPSLFPEAKYL